MRKCESKRTVRILFTLFLSGLSFFCSEAKKTNVIVYDLSRILNDPKVTVEGSFSEKDPLFSHWKKNPGRHSSLPISEKWKNTQITFNTDKNLFINHSLDAIYFPPNSSYLFKIEPGTYSFQSMTGILSDSFSEAEGILILEVDGKEKISETLGAKNRENWKQWKTDFDVKETIRFVWKSSKSHLYLAEPLLYGKKASPGPNVILIVLDSARKDFFGSYGYPYPITPNMDLLAKESVFFENPFSNGNWTKPSMMSFFHSEYSSNLGLGNSWFTTKPYQRKVYYGKKRDNLVNSFREKGYYTKSIMNNVFFLDYTTVGIDLGFHNSYQVGMDILDTPELTNHALSFLEEYSDRPFFLHFNLNTPHASYSPPPEDMAAVKKIIPSEVFYKYESPVQRYIGEMHYTDREVGRLISKLKELKIYDNTMIILTGDHGELFSPHHDYSYHFIMRTRFGHGETHYDEEINVPYFIKLPKSTDESVRTRKIPHQSSLLSLVPTVLGLAGISHSSDQYKGVDYSVCILGKKKCPEEKMIYTEGRMSESVRTEEYKYVRRYPGFTTVRRTIDGEPHTMAEELYDLKKDPEERNNLSLEPNSSLLAKARQDFAEGNFLKRNRIHIYLPPCPALDCVDSGSFQIQGSVYDWQASEQTQIQSSSAKTIQFRTKTGSSSQEFQVHTVNPEMDGNFFLFRNGVPALFRVGKWGLESKGIGYGNWKDLLVSERKPNGWENSDLPWIYNDGYFSGTTESQAQKEMGQEVKKILETWGYIHE
ncbi:DUF229 domain-containing protein [Leptospira idonii]|uniref:DUF229 domain-containing protein n=1 Tax=Leptospira idonii TaxID=1193500 RepID=A0A4V3JY43_9LEPT|nr:DUF229 domain-containing protein [Leptospira idonii]